MSVNVKLPASLEALTKLELIKLVRDLSKQRPQAKTPSTPNGSLAQLINSQLVASTLKRRASQAEVVDVPAQKRRRVASPMQSQVRGEALASTLTGDAKKRRMEKREKERIRNDYFKTQWAEREKERIQKRQTDLANHRAAPPKARIRAMTTTRKGFRFGRGDAVANLKITTPVFGDTNDGGTLKKEIALVESGRYTNPGELLLKIWTSAQPVPRKLLRGSSRSSSLAMYLLRLKKTELVEEDKDGFRLSSTFKPWMLTGVPSTSAKFKPSVQGLFEANSFMSNRRGYFREVHKQAGGLPSVK